MTAAAAVGYDVTTQPLEGVPACPLCAAANPSEPIVDRYGCPLGVSRCACGFVYLNPRLTPEGYATLYRDWYRPLLGALTGRDPATIPDEGHQRAFGRRLARACPEIPAGGHVLDAGGSTGAVAEGWNELQHPPCTVTVLDPCVSEVQKARARGFSGIVGTLEAFEPPPRRFAGAFCIQTIDHVSDPIAALTRLRQAVHDKGWLLVDYARGTIAVGTTMRLTGRGLERVLPHPPKLDHPCYWTRATLTAALTRTGWTITRFLCTAQKGLLVCRAA